MDTETENGRADCSVWLPILAILGSIADRVTRRQNEETAGPKRKTADDAAAIQEVA